MLVNEFHIETRRAGRVSHGMVWPAQYAAQQKKTTEIQGAPNHFWGLKRTVMYLDKVAYS